jgi:hypothetical protein
MSLPGLITRIASILMGTIALVDAYLLQDFENVLAAPWPYLSLG